MLGSSPRVRGAVHDVVSQVIAEGIIPACAGSSTRTSKATTGRWDHPRVCGEQVTALRQTSMNVGSSPRVRGAGHRRCDALGRTGIIPACAGSSHSFASQRECSRDHPRVCGEQWPPHAPRWCPPGSSPRVRGAGGRTRSLKLASGIIPACAGSSYRIGAGFALVRDHPRVCGEQWLRSFPHGPFQGSSPRVRGAVASTRSSMVSAGIIPACAGSRRPDTLPEVGERDHPRVCGEQLSSAPTNRRRRGSSPRVRGAGGARSAR